MAQPAKYGEPACPVSTCAAVVFRSEQGYINVNCPIGTEMEIMAVRTSGGLQYTFTAPSGVDVSGDMPSGCYLVSGIITCPTGSPISINFVHSTAPCQPTKGKPCPLPLTGQAYGECVALSCARDVSAAEVLQLAKETHFPTMSPVAGPVGSPVAPVGGSPVGGSSIASSGSGSNQEEDAVDTSGAMMLGMDPTLSLFFLFGLSLIRMVFRV